MKTNTYIEDKSANLVSIRDPMVLVVGDTYYLTGTQPPYWEGDNAGVHLWSSKDLEHFTDHGNILSRDDMPESMWCRDRFWAPELFDGHDGWFYLTFNCRNDKTGFEHSSGLARAREITGPYEIMTKDQPLLKGANDATLFRDDDGSTYFGITTGPIKLYRIDLETGELSQEQEICRKGVEGEWDCVGIEGSCVVKRHGIYFHWYSSWTLGYAAGVLTSDSIHGPWKKSPSNPIIFNGPIWHNGGHNHSFRGLDGRDYVTFHAASNDPDAGETERFFIQPVEYHPDGTVTIG